jgi:hypothetical protein
MILIGRALSCASRADHTLGVNKQFMEYLKSKNVGYVY